MKIDSERWIKVESVEMEAVVVDVEDNKKCFGDFKCD